MTGDSEVRSGNETCICTAELFEDAPEQDIYTINRDPICPVHGDGTPYWNEVVTFAKDLAARFNLSPGESTGRAGEGQ